MHLSHRREFYKLLDAMDCRTGVEIGVANGYFARQLLQSTKLEQLWLVDVWDNHEDWDAVNKLAAESNRVHIYRGTSEQAAHALPDVDFGYIDACHEYEFIREDIDQWNGKIMKCIAGHDYAFYNSVAGYPNGVVLAVEETFGDQVQVTGANNGRIERMRAAYLATVKKDYGTWAEDVPSWYVIKCDYL